MTLYGISGKKQYRNETTLMKRKAPTKTIQNEKDTNFVPFNC